MKARSEHTKETWCESIAPFLPYFPESVPLFFMSALGLCANYYLDREAMRNSSHVWLGPAASLLGTFIMSYFGRHREARDGERLQKNHRDELVYKDMDIQFKLGEEDLKQQNFLSALDHFSEGFTLFNQIFNRDTRAKAAELKQLCVYKQGLALYGLKRYDEAKSMISTFIPANDILNLSPLQIGLVNLRGLINFIQGRITDKQTLWKESKIDFERTYRVDPSQNNVYLYLQYLNGNYRFICENIPNEQWNPKVHLNFEETDILFDGIMILCADACIHQKKWAHAICLYENYLTASQMDSNAFTEIFWLNLNCFKAYARLLESSDSKSLTLFEIFVNEKGQKLEATKYDRKTVIAAALNRFETAKACLEGELFICQNETDFLNKHRSHVNAYNALAMQSSGLECTRHQYLALRAKANEHSRLIDNETKNHIDERQENSNHCSLF